MKEKNSFNTILYSIDFFSVSCIDVNIVISMIDLNKIKRHNVLHNSTLKKKSSVLADTIYKIYICTNFQCFDLLLYLYFRSLKTKKCTEVMAPMPYKKLSDFYETLHIIRSI